MLTALRYEGEFAGLSGPTRLTESQFFMIPFHDDGDFETLEMLARPTRNRWVQTKVTYTQKYLLLEQVLTTIRECAENEVDEILLNSRMPSAVRMPLSMIGRDIFVVLDVDLEAARIKAEGHSVVVVRERLVRNALEEGANEFVLDWHNPPEHGCRLLMAMIKRFESLGFQTRAASIPSAVE